MKKTLGVLFVSLLSVSGWSQAVDPASGHAYEVFSAPGITWIAAEQLALTEFDGALEGHLVTINSAEEDAFVGAVVQNAGLGEVWAGGYQNPITETTPTAGWTWVNAEGSFPGVNSTSPYANWNGGEPNDAYGPGSEQYLGLNLGAPGGFNDEGNLNYIDGYVVEFDPNTISTGGLVPDGASTASLLMGTVTLLGAASRRFRK